MNDERKRYLDKVRKCLRLAKSSNEHEAAAALRHAQALMREHGFSDADLHAAEAGEARANARSNQRYTKWEGALAGVVSGTTGCEVIFCVGIISRGEWMFIGTQDRQLIAQYAFSVLLRQIERARSAYIKTHLKRCGPKNRTARADAYCFGWVAVVANKITPLLISEHDRTAIDAYSKRYLTYQSKAVDRVGKLSGSAHDDFCRGARDGVGIDLRAPMAGGREQRKIGAAS